MGEVIPGWTREVEPFRLSSNAAYRVWLGAGKPRQGEVHKAKLAAHAQYRHAVRRVKRASKLHQARGLYDAAMMGDIELMKELRRVKSGKGEVDELSSMVDGVSGDSNVANKFKEVFQTLYNWGRFTSPLPPQPGPPPAHRPKH